MPYVCRGKYLTQTDKQLEGGLLAGRETLHLNLEDTYKVSKGR